MVTDPDFLRRFRGRHWKPIGVFSSSSQSGRQDISFSFISDQLGSIPPERFSVSVRCEGAGSGGDDCAWEFQGCRHGLVLLINRTRYGIRQMLVWNPVTGEQHLLGVPVFSDPSWNRPPFNMSGAVICPFGDKGPFKVAVAWNVSRSAHVCIYSSETGVWGDVVSAAVQSESLFAVGSRNVILGNSLYWILFGSQLRILEIDLGRENIAVIEVPLPPNACTDHCGLRLTTLGRGCVPSLLVMSTNLRAQLWERMEDSDGIARWMLGRTIELDRLLSLRSQDFPEHRTVLGLDGDDNVVFVSTYRGVFMVHLKLMQFEKVFENNPFSHDGTIHPFANLYAPGSGLTKGSLGS
ncbi:unnamed protein product [Urochloa decumbens]|uniref:F-box protein AT5G49610-like beta-propeller domain-containing protein n=1 Tax=Urochloa decumbens TaxID=240449 RepID=A0ABC9B257_9POAL